MCEWETEEASNNIRGGSNASLLELKHLSNLTTLDINIKDYSQLPFNFFYDKFKHFKIFIGDMWEWHAEHATLKMLKLKLSQRNQCDQGLETIELSLLNLISLESVCSGKLAVDSFKRLKIIKVKNCPKLKNFFPRSMLVHEVLELEKIEVEDYKGMKEIVEGKEEQLVDEVNDPIEFHGLRSLTLQSLPELTSLSSNQSPLLASTRNPMQLFNHKVILNAIERELNALQYCSYQQSPVQKSSVVFPQLEDLILSSIPLNELWDDQLSTRLCWIRNLSSLTVEGCDGLTFLCSSSMSMNLFLQLKTLKLETLVLEAIGKLETFCASASYIEFPCLQGLIIKDCSKLGPFIIDPRMRKNVIDTAGHHLFDEKVGFP
ncbi:hypothetical protein FNV43_RR08851 [Rhamnella rubrinervis]|uniref:Disease resistance protein At4g27190-like leucine-rich repeats domain-containing protein n=1 Tax=Rhamnella rubrinervis TaxID=2594499 RepID=A0A8K0HA22_9ROSA|nr:hypothetical protein FNV43_RR08851 [Rhamnella rubrinervis]